MLHFILGRAGTGKTSRIADEVVREIASTERPVVLLVPEQQTVAWETKMAARLPASANLRLEITNFTRLANSVFREFGGLADPILDEGSRTLLVWRAMLSVRDALTVYRAPENMPGREDRSLPKLMRAVDDFKTAGVSPAEAAEILDRLEAAQGETSPDDDRSGSLLHRMRDAVLVYAAYEALLREPQNADRGIDRGDLFHHLIRTLRLHPFFRGKAVFVDSFFSLTAPEQTILDLIFRQADEVWVTFACPPADTLSGDEFQFAEVREFYKTAVRLANRADLPFERIALTENVRHRSAPLLARVEKNLFRYAGGETDPSGSAEIPESERKSVRILRCADLWDEAEACASLIDRLLRDGYAPRDIAVVARNIESRAGITDAVLRAHGIPCFLSESTAVSHSPAVRLVLAALSVEANVWQRRDVMRLIKTGLTPAGDADGSDETGPFAAFAEDAFEQYAATWNIRGRRMFESPRWSMNPAGYRTEITPAGKALLDLANGVKDRVIPPLARFLSLFADGPAPVRDIAAGIVTLAEDYGIAARLTELGDACRALGLPADAMRAESSWDAVCRILDSMVEILGDTALDAGRCAGLFARAAAALDVGTIPTGQDEVVLGSASGVRFDEAGCVIMLGTVDGEFPGSVSDGPSFFDDRDKALLESVGLSIGGPDTAMQSAREAFMFYRTAASASKLLFLLAPADGGKTLSEGARRIGDILETSGCPGVQTFGELPLSEILYHPATAEYLLSRRPDRADQEILSALVGAADRPAVPLTGVSDRIARAQAAPSDRMRLSETRINTFLTCPFRYACRYQVKLEEPAEARITAADVGIFVHAVLERYFTEYPPSDTPPSEEDMRKAASRIIRDYMDELARATGDDLSADGRLNYLFRRLERHVLVFLRAISEEMAQSGFRPAAFEMPIGLSAPNAARPIVIRTPDGASVTLDGIADRVDVWQSGGKEYLRIVDYKTGSKSFSLERVARGLDVQALLYLFSVWKNGLPGEVGEVGGSVRGREAERVPAGAVYFTIKPQPVSADHLLTADEARALAEEKIERAGVWLNDEEVLRAMDRELSGRYVPVKENKDGSLAARGRANLATLEEFGEICGEVESVIGQIAGRIRAGSAEAKPQRVSGYDPCASCAHRVICRRRAETGS